jgi:hypothetical protein
MPSARRGQTRRPLAVRRVERGDAIRQAYRDGLPVRDIAAVLKFSHPHVSRIKCSG